ncbi:MAG: HAD-IA family hydrolase [Patescibacteria group bacterium]
MNPPIKFIFFDVGDVMLRFRHEFEEYEKMYGMDSIKGRDLFLKEMNNLSLGNTDPQTVWKMICQELGHNELSKKKIIDLERKVFTPIMETHTLVKDLSKKYEIGILSNIFHGTFEMELQAGLIPNIDYKHIVESCKISLKKPDKAIFEHAQSLLDVPKETVLLVDDLEKNCVAAREFGWQAFQFDEINPSISTKKIRSLLNF